MANLTDIKSNTLGSIAAVQTLLERYPVLITTNSLRSISGKTTSFNFMFDILQIIGVNNDKLLEWASNILAGDGTNGVLDKIEIAIKTILKLNIKNILTCTVNPIIPDDLLDEHEVIDGDNNGERVPLNIITEGAGIEIDLSTMDFTGTLKISPTSSIGNYYYFDNNMTPTNLYKSRDFNSFLWYCVNKGLNTKEGKEKYKMIWDNRNAIKTNPMPDSFFTALTPEEVADYNKNYVPNKKQIIQCQFIENNFPYGDKLKVQICSESYYKNRKILGTNKKNIYMNKTIFEFNNDYIDSLKLFDSKVLMAQIINRLTGSLAISVNYNIDQIITQGKIDTIIKKIIESDDTNISDCFYSFSNEEYDTLLQEATLKHAEQYKFSGDENVGIKFNSEELLDFLSGITSEATLQENVTTIKNTFTEVSATLAQDGNVSISDSFNFGINIIYQMIYHIISALIESILSPKVMILLAINSHIMGKDLPKNVDEILEGFGNIIVSIIKEIKDIILNELYNFLMSELTPLIELYVSKITLETIKFYKELLNNLLESCISSSGTNVQSVIDNVNYADIIPVENVPNQNKC